VKITHDLPVIAALGQGLQLWLSLWLRPAYCQAWLRSNFDLSVDFSWLMPSLQQWYAPAGKILVASALIPVFFASVLVMLVTAWMGEHGMWMRAGVYALVCGALACLLGGIIVSAIWGLAGGAVSGLLLGLTVGLTPESHWQPIWLLPLAVLSASLSGSVLLAIEASLPCRLRWEDVVVSVAQTLIGLIGTALLMVLGVTVLPMVLPRSEWWQPQLLGLGLSAGIGWGIATRRWRSALGLALFYVLALTGLWRLSNFPAGAMSALVGSAGNSLFFLILFSLAYQFAVNLAGIRAGLIAGLVGTCIIYLTQFPAHQLGLICAVAAAIGLGRRYWQPAAFYWLEMIISLVLLHRDMCAQEIRYLPWHPVFWDEWQTWRFFKLDQHITLALQRGHPDAEQWLHTIANGPQRWAAQAAAQEILLQQMESANPLAAIAACHFSANLPAPFSAFSTIRSAIACSVEQPLSPQAWHYLHDAHNGLRELLHDLLHGPVSATAQRHSQIAHHWLQLVETELSLRQQAQQTARELISPYRVGIPITLQEQAIFVGRESECQTLQHLLRWQHGPAIYLHGQRRMGKTSLLHNISRLLPPAYLPLFVDLQSFAAAVKTTHEFWQRLAKDIHYALQQSGNTGCALPMSHGVTEDFSYEFKIWLTGLRQANPGRVLLFLLDEFDALALQMARERLDGEAIMEYLRHLIQHQDGIRWIFAGGHSWQEDALLHRFLVNVEVVPLGYLDAAAARRLIVEPVPTLQYEPQAVAEILYITHCHPALLQLLCDSIVRLKNQQPGLAYRQVSLADVLAAVPDSLIRARNLVSHFWDVPLAWQPLLRALARAERAQWQPQQWLQTQCGLDEAEWNVAQAGLLQKGIVEISTQGCRIAVELVRLGFAKVDCV